MEEILKAKNSIENARNIGILTKTNASDDAIGATLALFFALKSANKKTFFPVKEIPEKISNLLKNRQQKRFRISFKEDVSEVYYEKNDNGIDLYLTPKNGKADDESFSYKIISNSDYLTSDNSTGYDLLLTVGIEEFKEVEDLCADNLDQLYGCTVLNIDVDLNNQNYGEINLIEDSQSLSQKISCFLKALGGEYMNKDVANFLLYGLTTSTKNIKNKKNVPTIKWLFKHGGNLNLLEDNTPQMKLLETVLKNINYVEEENIYSSSLSEKNILDCGATSKDLAFVVEKIKNFFKLPSFLLLWESRTSPLSVKGIFYSDKKPLVEKIANNFKGVSKGNGTLFLTEQTSINLAKDMVLSCLK
jgi:nanoRNase/pAp phosphatase (c-di-AMP/oligoRNAs hydrolase)